MSEKPLLRCERCDTVEGTVYRVEYQGDQHVLCARCLITSAQGWDGQITVHFAQWVGTSNTVWDESDQSHPPDDTGHHGKDGGWYFDGDTLTIDF